MFNVQYILQLWWTSSETSVLILIHSSWRGLCNLWYQGVDCTPRDIIAVDTWHGHWHAPVTPPCHDVCPMSAPTQLSHWGGGNIRNDLVSKMAPSFQFKIFITLGLRLIVVVMISVLLFTEASGHQTSGDLGLTSPMCWVTPNNIPDGKLDPT